MYSAANACSIQHLCMHVLHTTFHIIPLAHNSPGTAVQTWHHKVTVTKQPNLLPCMTYRSVRNNKAETLATSELYIVFLLAFDDRTLWGDRLQLLSHLLVVLA